MKQYAQFFHNSVVSIHYPEQRLIGACGDRSVLVLDGRSYIGSYHRTCKAWAIQHGYLGYQLIVSSRFIDSNNVINLINEEDE